MKAIVKRIEGFAETELDGEIVVMKLDSGDFFSITGTGCVIWRLIDGTRDRDAVIGDLCESFAAPADEIAADLDAFLQTLSDEGLLAAV